MDSPNRKRHRVTAPDDHDQDLRAQIGASTNLGASLALTVVQLLREAVAEIFPRHARRFRWPMSGGFRFEALPTRDNHVLLIIRDRPHTSVMQGSGPSRKPQSRAIRPRTPRGVQGWHDTLRRRLSLDPCDAVFLVPVRTMSMSVADIASSWIAQDKAFVAIQAGLNLEHHRRLLAIPPPAKGAGPKEPRRGTNEARVLEQLRSGGRRFQKLPNAAKIIDRLRKYGHEIESARQARAAGKPVSSDAVGWRLSD